MSSANTTNEESNVVSVTSYIRSNIREYGMLIALVAIMVFFQFYTGGILFRPVNLTNLILQNSFIVIMALGMLLVIVAGHIDLSVGSIVAFVGAIGQPDSFAGELPCAYVELVEGAEVTVDELADHARTHIHERAAIPKHLEILAELPKTAVGKIFKPDLRRMAIRRVYDAALEGTGAHVVEVIEDKKRGLVARLSRDKTVDEAAVGQKLGEYTPPWEWAD